jgi:endo-1,4-beta-xylanase
MKRTSVLLLLASLFISGSTAAQLSSQSLRNAYSNDFLIGVALNTSQVNGQNAKAGEIAARQFSSLTPENEMKWQSIHPQPEVYRFEGADAYAGFARAHKMALIGHTLVWHSQTPDWVFKGKEGGDATREELLRLMKEHIHTVVGHFKGKVKGWDVVNEALSDGGPDILRNSPWRRIIGDDYLDYAFRFAKEADPDAELYYNDYGLENENKRRNCVALLRGMIERGVPINGVGTQSHFQLNHPSLDEVEKTIKDFSALGLKVMVTELDVDVLPSRNNSGNADISRREEGGDSSNPYINGLPADMQEKLAKRYADLFDCYLRHRKFITRVTLWGLGDETSWLNNFPIRGRTNYPLLIDRELKPKSAFFAVMRKRKEFATD